MTHPLLHVATPEKRARRNLIRDVGKRQAKKLLRGRRGLPALRDSRERLSQRKAFHRVDAAFRALRVAAFAQLPVYRSRGRGKGARR